MEQSKFDTLRQHASLLSPIEAAVIYPNSKEALAGAIMAAKEGFIKPVLLGNKKNILRLAAELQENIDEYQLIDLDEQSAIEEGVKLARNNEVKAIIKGSVHTGALMSEIVNSERGLRTARRMSHCFVADVPAYKKLLIITDAALNVSPHLTEKRHIVQNAIELAQSLEIAVPKVALLSAVETITEDIPSTLECADLCKMAQRDQLIGGIVDGPLSLDLAISEESAKIKKIKSEVTGDADILVVPNLESGNILFKSLNYFANATSLGIILGAKTPIVLISRSADVKTRSLSCMLAKFAHYEYH